MYDSKTFHPLKRDIGVPVSDFAMSIFTFLCYETEDRVPMYIRFAILDADQAIQVVRTSDHAANFGHEFNKSVINDLKNLEHGRETVIALTGRVNWFIQKYIDDLDPVID